MTTYEAGQHNAICQRCGFKYKARQLSKEWTGLRVCRGGGTNDCWEIRHPQEFLRGKADRQAPPWSSPEPEPIDISPGSGNEITREDL